LNQSILNQEVESESAVKFSLFIVEISLDENGIMKNRAFDIPLLYLDLITT